MKLYLIFLMILIIIGLVLPDDEKKNINNYGKYNTINYGCCTTNNKLE